MPELKPSRAATYLQQDMDKELSVGVCAQVTLPYPPGLVGQTNHDVTRSGRQSDCRHAVHVLSR